ncbi:RHS repeat-associated core domain-containing protein, partial [Undibacterium sp. Ji83W]|uniref:RHS repeat-associated core domain-containing protein n=1 Tax=Undibacterium sp. Ji83W TaxID=3413043 RepID=UPI003BEFE2EF
AVTANTPKAYDIHADHLNTPRVITDATGTEVWRWDSAPFGETLPNEQPQGNQQTKFTFNQRFPGQYFDAETGLHYNYFRDYDPLSGRYVQSDPIGLRGGINTFGYVGADPLSGFDPKGLIKWEGTMLFGTFNLMKGGPGGGIISGGMYSAEFTLVSACLRGQKWIVVVGSDGWGFGAGSGMTGRGSGGLTTTNLDDGLDYINPYVFNGRFEYITAGGFQYSPYAAYNLGEAAGDASGWGLSTDKYGLGVYSGMARVKSAKVVKCDCK